MRIENRAVKISKRAAVSQTRKLASMFSRFDSPKMIKNKSSIISPQEVLEGMVKAFSVLLDTKHKKDCLQALNEDIEKKYKGVSRKLINADRGK